MPQGVSTCIEGYMASCRRSETRERRLWDLGTRLGKLLWAWTVSASCPIRDLHIEYRDVLGIYLPQTLQRKIWKPPFLILSSEGSQLNYPEGTVLLDTRLRYGELSYDVDDLQKMEENWYPPQEIRQSLQNQYKSTPEAQVKLVVRQNRLIQNVNILKYPLWKFWRWQCTLFWAKMDSC